MKKIETQRKGDGFAGELCLIVPPSNKDILNQSVLASSLYVTDIGYFPRAKGHYRKREKGCNEHILIHCIDGKGKIWFNDKTYNLSRNDYIVIQMGVSHCYEADHENPWTIYWVHFVGSNSMEIVRLMSQAIKNRQNSLIFTNDIKSRFDKVYSLLSTGFGKDVMESVALVLASYLQPYAHPGLANLELAEQKEDTILRAVKFLKDNLKKKISLQEVAENNNLSASHFTKLFKERTGYSPIEFLNNLKIQEACYLLRYSNLRISEISDELAFADQYYFSRLFKIHMGMSPLNYKKINRNQRKE